MSISVSFGSQTEQYTISRRITVSPQGSQLYSDLISQRRREGRKEMSRSFLRPHFSIDWHLAENSGAAGKQFLRKLTDAFLELELGRRKRMKPKKRVNEREEEKATCSLPAAADSDNKSVTFGLHSVLRWIEADGARVVLFDGQLIKPSALGLFLGAYAGGRLTAYAVTDLNTTCRSALNLPNVRAIGFAREQGVLPLIEEVLDAAITSLKACEFLPAAGARSQRQLPAATVMTVPLGKKQKKKSLSKKRRKADKKRNGSAKKP